MVCFPVSPFVTVIYSRAMKVMTVGSIRSSSQSWLIKLSRGVFGNSSGAACSTG